jgi:DNA-binding NarL/FixJ family response regulator
MAKRILIADDSANMRGVIRALLANVKDIEIWAKLEIDWMRLNKL